MRRESEEREEKRERGDREVGSVTGSTYVRGLKKEELTFQVC
jgi:hypothetical protein